MHERSLVSVKVEPRSTSRLISALFNLPLFYLRDENLRALACVSVRSQKRVSGNQPLVVPTLVPRALAKVESTLNFIVEFSGEAFSTVPRKKVTKRFPGAICMI